MSTTFGITVNDEDGYAVEVEVAFRGNLMRGNRWLHPLAPLLPDSQEIEALDNSPQGVYTIGDFRKIVNQ